MDYTNTFLFIRIVFLLALMSPGPNNVAITTHAMKSRWSGVLVAYGVSTASVTWATLAIAELGFIIASLPWLLEALRILGAAYLMYLGALFFAARTAPRCQMLAQRGERTLN